MLLDRYTAHVLLLLCVLLHHALLRVVLMLFTHSDVRDNKQSCVFLLRLEDGQKQLSFFFFNTELPESRTVTDGTNIHIARRGRVAIFSSFGVTFLMPSRLYAVRLTHILSSTATVR